MQVIKEDDRKVAEEYNPRRIDKVVGLVLGIVAFLYFTTLFNVVRFDFPPKI